MSRLRALLARIPRGTAAMVSALIAAAILLYYGLGGWLASRTDTDPALRPRAELLPPGGSVALAMAGALMERELDRGWTPNDSILSRTAFLENMPAYQAALRETVAGFVAADTVAGEPGPAAELLAVPSDRWWLQAGWPPVSGGAEASYRDAVARLAEQNAELKAGTLTLDRSPAHVAALLGALGAGIDAAAGVTDRAVRGRPLEGDPGADVQFFANRGRAYATAMLLRGMRDDHAALIRAAQLGAPWNAAIEALDEAAGLDPWQVGSDDLTRQGYDLLVARGLIRDMAARLEGRS